MRNAFLLIFAFAALIVSASAADIEIIPCSYSINGNNSTYLLQNSCPAELLTFAQNASGNRVQCTNSSAPISGVSFLENTYNNSIVNCTFAGSALLSMHNAMNNVISPRGSYSFSFSDNSSNIALGYWLTFMPRWPFGPTNVQAFASVVPYELAMSNFGKFNNQQLDIESIRIAADAKNFTLPRFGVYPPAKETRSITFAIETVQISKNATRSFNPYWFICPYWGYDILSYYSFNMTQDATYTPMYLSPTMSTNIQMPDNTNVFWNYTIENYGNATDVTAYVFPSYQFSGAKPIATISNFSFDSGKFSYDAGVLSLGTHEYITELVSDNGGRFQQSNSTTVNYAIGLSFCTELEPPIRIPGYYSMAYNTLTRLNVYHPSGNTCGTAVTIMSNDVTIDCRGGEINSTVVDFQILDVTNVTVKNCNLKGNAFLVRNSNVTVENSTMTANNQEDIALRALSSDIKVSKVSFSGYLNSSELVESAMTTISPVNETNSTVIQTTDFATLATPLGGIELEGALYLVAAMALAGMAMIIYSLVCSMKKKREASGRKKMK
jgi:hypothetical protein